MTQERLNGLALMSIHRDIPNDYDKILNIFARKHSRRMELINMDDDKESDSE